ncbi:MAG: restriction endonuclease subunit S [Candidatus Azotimanducaceae bacterium WSBS_2022_MAG_OTU7]
MSKSFQQYSGKLNGPGAKAGLNLPAVRGFPLTMAAKDEQGLIAGKLDKVDNKVQVEKILLEKLNFQKSCLMQDLLTGKVPVKLDQPQAMDCA